MNPEPTLQMKQEIATMKAQGKSDGTTVPK